MELSWIYAWVALLSGIIQQKLFSLTAAAVALITGVLVSVLADRRGFRVVTVILIYLAGFTAATIWALCSPHFSAGVLFGHGRFLGLAGWPRGFAEWGSIILTVIPVVLFWAAGIGLAKRPKTYYAFCARFDIGLAAFFCLFLLKLMMFVKAGIRTDQPAAGILMAVFLLCGLFALGMSRLQNGEVRAFLPGYRRLGIILGYASTLILAVTGLVLWSMERLGSLAVSTHRVVKETAGSALPLVEQLIRIVFARGNVRPEASASGSRGSTWGVGNWAGDYPWMEYVEKMLGWGLWGVFVILCLVLAGLGVLLIVRWLLSRTVSDPRSRARVDLCPPWLLRLWEFLRTFAHAVRRIGSGYRCASDIYAGFLRWARRSGISPLTGETPLEFGRRLSRHVPGLAPEINTIVDSYNREVYGGMRFTGNDPIRVRRAWRVLRSPLNWPPRLRARLAVLNRGDREPRIDRAPVEQYRAG